MTSPEKLEANRLNALKSTGPRTAEGKARSARNSLATGLYSTLAVIPTLGETAEDWGEYQARAVADLAPRGPFEEELAARAVRLMWRLRRIELYEAATVRPRGPGLPPDPDAVEPDDCGLDPPSPADPAASRLAYARFLRVQAEDAADGVRAAAERLEGLDHANPAEPVDDAVGAVRDLVGAEMGWSHSQKWPAWEALLQDARIESRGSPYTGWTAGQLLRTLAAAARTRKVHLAEFLVALSAQAQTEYAIRDRIRQNLAADEAALVDVLRVGRARAAARRLHQDDEAATRVVRAESHALRQLERILRLLERGRNERDRGARTADSRVEVLVVGRFSTSVPGGPPLAEGRGFVWPATLPDAAAGTEEDDQTADPTRSLPSAEFHRVPSGPPRRTALAGEAS